MADIFEGLSTEGWKAGWEPGKEIFLGYESEVEKIEQKYPVGTAETASALLNSPVLPE